ncbi:TRAP transporter large permease [Sneathiella sp.]|uniref:TRAP transporter large permease n=1 Tax=Sneathiella sp. TaxID=1964365 RepID=UPI002605DEC6|nr:TRAP transporter large permease [Sneathiella sp.]MDF2369073.1 TRAP transporter large permease [Sneathiella sp.]
MLIASLGFLLAFLLIFLRVPIALSMAMAGFLGFGYLVGWPQAMTMMAFVARDTAMSYTLIVVPLFLLMGNLVAGAGISYDLFRSAQSFLSARRGGLASATIVASAGFAAICGSSVATVVTMAKVAIPSMREFKYDDQISTASIAAGATLGILIPPSVILLIYGVATETHIGKLYAAGLFPGLLGVALYLLAVRWAVSRNPDFAPEIAKERWSTRFHSLTRIWPALLLFILVIGGIYGGIFTATEAAGIGAGGALALAIVRRSLSFVQFYAILLDTAKTSVVLLTLVLGAGIFSEFLNYSGAHSVLLNFILDSNFSPWMVIAIICVIYILLGMVMETMSMILLTVPIFFPIVMGLGYDPVWFGILIVVLAELGLITPPIGINLFVIKSIVSEVSISTIVRGIIPFICADLVRVALIALFPIISLYLPSLLFG